MKGQEAFHPISEGDRASRPWREELAGASEILGETIDDGLNVEGGLADP
jgi:hypothetical protein